MAGRGRSRTTTTWCELSFLPGAIALPRPAHLRQRAWHPPPPLLGRRSSRGCWSFSASTGSPRCAPNPPRVAPKRPFPPTAFQTPLVSADRDEPPPPASLPNHQAEATLRTEMEARMDTSAEDESNDGDHGAMSPSSGNEDPSTAPRSTPSHTKVGTSPRGTPMDVTKLAAVIDEIEADMVDDDADAVNARAEDEDPDREETPPDDDRLDRDSAKTRSPDAHKEEDDDDEDKKRGASRSNCPTNASPRRTTHTSTATRTPPNTPPCSHGGRWTTWTYTTFTTPATTSYPSIDARRTDSSARSSSAANATTTAFMRTRAWGGGNPRLARRRSRPTRGRGAMTSARRVHKEGTPTVGRGTALKIGKRMIEPALTPPRTATSQAPAGSPSARGSQRQRRGGAPAEDVRPNRRVRRRLWLERRL